MPWFRIDDKAHSHPKLIKAGNAALGLWLRCGSYAAAHLTDGIVPGVVAELYGTKPQAAKLVKAGLWHEHGHDCPECPQPAPGDYAFHDFLDDGRNTSRARYEAEKKKARDRQTKHREGQRDGGDGEEKAPRSAGDSKRFSDESSSKKSESASEKSPFLDDDTGQGQESRRDVSVTGIHAAAAPYRGTSYGSTAAAAEQPARGLPDTLAELKRGIAAANLQGIAWDLKPSQMEYARQAMDRVGVPAMVAFAVNSSRLKGPPAGASAWVSGWRTLEPAPEQDGVAYLPAVAGGSSSGTTRQQQETDDLFGRAMQRAQLRQQQETS